MGKEYNLTMDDALNDFENAYHSSSLVKIKRHPSLLTGNLLYASTASKYSRLPRSRFYCGITNDLEKRVGEHNANILLWVKAKDVQSAIELERKLGERGFDIGSSAGKERHRIQSIFKCIKKYPV